MITLFPHQQEAIDWLYRHDGCGLIYADVGTGKTFCALGFIQRYSQGKVLIVCPASLVGQWCSEMESFWENSFPGTITVIHYEKLLNDKFLKELASTHWNTIVIDESQTINNPSAKKTKRLKKLKATHRIALSGTPFKNALYECWSVMDWLRPGILGKSFYWFKQNYLRLHPAFHGIVGYLPGAEEYIQKTIAPHIHHIHREEVLKDLPPKNEHYHWVDLSPTHMRLYNELKETLSLEIGSFTKLTVTNVISLIMRLRQLTDLPSALVGECEEVGVKSEELWTLLKGQEGKSLVFSEFATVATALAQSDESSLLITGAVPLKKRQEIVELFKSDPQHHTLYGTRAISAGLNLQCAHTVVHFGLPWTNADLSQRAGRAWRSGQTHAVEEHFILARGTIDEKMYKLIEKKKGVEGKFDKSELLSLLQ